MSINTLNRERTYPNFDKEPSRSGTGRVDPKNNSSSASRSGTGDDRGTTNVFDPAKVDRNLGGVASFSDTMDDKRHLRSYGIWPASGADKFKVWTVSFVVWAVD